MFLHLSAAPVASLWTLSLCDTPDYLDVVLEECMSCLKSTLHAFSVLVELVLPL